MKPIKKLSPKKPNKIVGKTVEDTYQRVDQHEHILIRPDSYIGSVEEDTYKMWIYNEEINKMVCRNINFVPGLYKIFDEIIVNARDHSVKDNTCKTIKVNIDK